ncbi:MAG: purine permease, partial [Proteobacteria bacterium]|nr:purine permease [Pseudomonadota bacterium]
NLAFNHFKEGNSDQQSVFVAGTDRTLSAHVLACLYDGDQVIDGKLYDKEGNLVPIAVAHAH